MGTTNEIKNEMDVKEPTVRVVFDLGLNQMTIWILGADEAQREKALARLAKVSLQIELLEAALKAA